MNLTLLDYIKTCSWEQLCKLRELSNIEYNERKLNDNCIITPRQKEILKLCCLNKNDIANRLNISFATVQTHYNDMYNRLLVSNKTSALVKCLKKGFIKIDEVELE